jgi:transcriptional regulator with XRE-family HTH domain
MEKRTALIIARLHKGLEQNKAAELMGVAQQTYSHWERGRTTPPARKMVELEKILGVPKEKLFPDVFGDGNLESNDLKESA